MSTSSRNCGRSRSPSPTRDIHGSEKYEEIPKEFFCPISKRFMSDPVTIPTSDLTYDRDSVKDLHKTEDVQPDLIMRKKMEVWLLHYDLEPHFNVEEENTLPAFRSVMKERRVGLLHEYVKMMKEKRWLLLEGEAIWYAASIILSYPNLPTTWITAALSLVADAKEDELEVPPWIRIFHEYSVLVLISRACDFESENQEFQKGLVNIMHALVMSQTVISPVMVVKLKGGIIEALVSYIWPVREHFIPNHYYSKLLVTLNRLSENETCCQHMIDAEIVQMLFILLEFGVSSKPEIRDNPDKASASLALGEFGQTLAIQKSMKILDRLCICSEKARARIGQMVEGELLVLVNVMHIFTVLKDDASFSAGLRVLGHYGGDVSNTFFDILWALHFG